jgi:hypothetical protein
MDEGLNMEERTYLEMSGESAKQQYKKSRASQLRDHSIVIRFLSRGMIIQIGCKEIPFTTIEEGMEAFNAYVANPHDETIKWMDILE